VVAEVAEFKVLQRSGDKVLTVALLADMTAVQDLAQDPTQVVVVVDKDILQMHRVAMAEVV
jgi:hypothetical protein